MGTVGATLGSDVSGFGVTRVTPVRLTRRGRLVFGLLLFVLAAVSVVLVAAPEGRAADPPKAPVVTVVRPGDTLWSIAERHAPDRDRHATVDEIRRLNRLDGYGLDVGQRLVLPATR
jgi:hypothetical protein